MAFSVKNWLNRALNPNVGETLEAYEGRLAAYAAANPTLVTPLTGASLQDLETRLSGYTDTHAAVTTAAHGGLVASSDTRIPTQGENDALAGTSGTPGGSNAFVTNEDTRLFALSVKTYGATGNGTTNDQGAIQAAINAANGRPVYFPPGVYRINTPLRLKPSTHLIGDWVPSWMYPEYGANGTWLRCGSGWSGPAMLKIYETSITGDASAPNGCRIEGLMLFCDSLAARGIYWRGDARDTVVRDVEVAYATTAGFQAEGNGSNPCQEINWWNCIAGLGTGAGWLLQARSFDHRLVGCVARTCGTDGFQVIGGTGGASSIEFHACRAEWNAGHGFMLYGPSTSSGIGKITMSGCVTDANEQNGVYIEHNVSVAGPINIVGHYSNRDGNNGGSGGRAGIRVHQSSRPVMLNAVTQRVGHNDDGSGINRPTYGVDQTGTATGITSLHGCYLAGMTAGYHNDAGGSVIKSGGYWQEIAGGTPTWFTPSP